MTLTRAIEQSPYRPELDVVGMPDRIRRLPIDRGYPVPWFVAWENGVPEFRAADTRKFVVAFTEGRCWVCGDKLGTHRVFAIGPMCGCNRVTSEPACHAECAEWSAINCPFLSRPHMTRREGGIEGYITNPGGIPILRNPGVTLLWWTREYHVFYPPKERGGGRLLHLGDPERVKWFAEGRPATRAEVIASIESGLPALREMCDVEPMPWDRRAAHADLTKKILELERWYPDASEATAAGDVRSVPSPVSDEHGAAVPRGAAVQHDDGPDRCAGVSAVSPSDSGSESRDRTAANR